MTRLFTAILLALAVSGCADEAGTAAGAVSDARTGDPAEQARLAQKILVTSADITDRRYERVADLEVTVHKSGIFDPDPTPDLVDDKLRAEAATLGADAVILARYGTVGVSFDSWGSLDGSGQAVRFLD